MDKSNKMVVKHAVGLLSAHAQRACALDHGTAVGEPENLQEEEDVNRGDIHRAPAKRKEEFIELITKHWHQLFNLIFCVVQNFSDAEDLFQQSTMALWADFDKFEPGTDFGAWASNRSAIPYFHVHPHKKSAPRVLL